jgi:radical SAM protein with 4Fe4S-binding SPASM domain
MSLDMFKGIVDDLHDLGTRRIDLIGRGEPLLNRAALEMVRYIKQRDMQTAMVTNGSRLFEPVAKGMVEAGADRLNVSLNAGTPETYPHIHVTETPEDFLKVKKNLRYLADCKIAANSTLPFISLSFVITSKNFFEIEKMIEVAHEVGAQEAQFVHTVVHSGTQDLMLSDQQYRQLHASLPAAHAKAAALGIGTTLKKFEDSIPPYMPSELVGPTVVPCYVGWYFAVILGNGSVLPCAQSAAPLGQVTKTRRFKDVWASSKYSDFRIAAKSLPARNELLKTCECDNCQFRSRNVSLHNFLHPFSTITAGDDAKAFTPGDFLRKMKGQHGHGAH